MLKKAIGWTAGMILAVRVVAKATETIRKRFGIVPVVLFSVFLEDLKRGNIQTVLMSANRFDVVARDAKMYRTIVAPMMDRTKLIEKLMQGNVKFGTLQASPMSKLWPLIVTMVPFIYLLLTYRMLGKLFHGPNDGVGKEQEENQSRRSKERISFKDVAGIDHARQELAEIVDALRNPEKYKAVGASMPRGILLCGPSGTGKTLLARALSHEADIPFMSCSASDFVEMLVGRGAARVRELFTRASKCAPSIIFVDELDALAKARGGLNSNDEREQTLNQLLTEMDGFDGRTDGVIVIAATNRPEVLDPALCRAGRFDRHVFVGYPNATGRAAILRVHAKKIRLSPTVNLDLIALKCPGTSGAELANIVNEAALMAVRQGELIVSTEHFEMALERSEKSTKVLRNCTAFALTEQLD